MSGASTLFRLRLPKASANFCAVAHAQGARTGPGKAVRIRRDPVTVTGDETRDGHWR